MMSGTVFKCVPLLCLLLLFSAATQPHFTVRADDSNMLWVDYPGSARYKERQPQWYDLIETIAGTSFVSNDGSTINVNYENKGGIHLFADPGLLRKYDDAARAFNGADASTMTGVVDRCGWPKTPAGAAPASAQYSRRTTPFETSFENGLDSTEMVIGLQKGCCEIHKYAPVNKFATNVNVVKDTVKGVEKNVLALTAWNGDNPDHCPGTSCYKDVLNSGTVATADLFASGRYEVIAKVPASSGLVWAMWTFHYEEHLPANCDLYTCYCSTMPNNTVMVEDKCDFRYDGSNRPCKYATVCDNNTDGWDPQPPPPKPILSPAECGAMHKAADPQFLENNTFGGWVTEVNHEIDIEIPANCAATPNVCNVPGPVPGSKTCIGEYNTANLNAYLWTQNSGTGPGYANMCVKATTAAGEPIDFVGGDKYRNYTIVWHSGGLDPLRTGARVDFYIDDVYVGTNNAFVPTRGSRLYLAHWGPQSKNPLWNGYPNDWGGGSPGDSKSYNSTTYISSVKVTPFNEPADLMYPQTSDLPDGCTPNYHQKYASSPSVCHSVWEAYDIAAPAS